MEVGGDVMDNYDIERLKEEQEYRLDAFKEFIEEIEWGIISSHEALTNYANDKGARYQLALSFLNLAETNFVKLRNLIIDINLFHGQIYDLIDSYKNYKRELETCILNNCDDCRELNDKKDKLINSCYVADAYATQIQSHGL